MVRAPLCHLHATEGPAEDQAGQGTDHSHSSMMAVAFLVLHDALAVGLTSSQPPLCTGSPDPGQEKRIPILTHPYDSMIFGWMSDLESCYLAGMEVIWSNSRKNSTRKCYMSKFGMTSGAFPCC